MPGETALTLIGASSVASGPTIASRAPLMAAKPAVPARGGACRARADEGDRADVASAAPPAGSSSAPRTCPRSPPAARRARVTQMARPFASAKGEHKMVERAELGEERLDCQGHGAVDDRCPARTAARLGKRQPSWSRPVMITSAPPAAKSVAVASPIPELPPMTTTRAGSLDMRSSLRDDTSRNTSRRSVLSRRRR